MCVKKARAKSNFWWGGGGANGGGLIWGGGMVGALEAERGPTLFRGFVSASGRFRKSLLDAFRPSLVPSRARPQSATVPLPSSLPH